LASFLDTFEPRNMAEKVKEFGDSFKGSVNEDILNSNQTSSVDSEGISDIELSDSAADLVVTDLDSDLNDQSAGSELFNSDTESSTETSSDLELSSDDSSISDFIDSSEGLHLSDSDLLHTTTSSEGLFNEYSQSSSEVSSEKDSESNFEISSV